MAESEGSIPEREAEAVSPKKKRKGCVLTGLAIFLVVAVVGLLILNGPGFRLLAHFAGLKALGAAGYSGDFKIEGTIWSGFTLSAADLSAETEDTGKIQFEEISLSYSFLDLLRSPKSLGWLDEFHIRDAKVNLVLPEPDKTTKPGAEKNSRGYTLPELDPVWGLLAADLRIEDLTLFIHQGERVYSVENLDLALPKEGSGHLRIDRVAIPGQADLAGIDATITRGEGFLEIGPLPLVEGVAVETLALQKLEPAGIRLDTKVSAAGGGLEASVALEPESRFSLTAGLTDGSAIDLSQLPVPAVEPLSGKISELNLSVQGSVEKPATWKVEGKVAASAIAWDEKGIDSATILLQQNVLGLEVRRGEDILKLDATVPLQSTERLEQLAALPVDANLELAVPDLRDTLAAFAIDQPVAGSLRVEGNDFRFSKEGIFSGQLALETQNLAWDGTAIEASANARVTRPDFVDFKIDLALDEANAVAASGNFDLAARSYEATASIAARISGTVGNLITKATGKGAAGTINAKFTGSGTLTDAQHRGSLALDAEELTFGGIPPVAGRLAANYSGATASVEKMEFSSAGLALSGTANWDGARLVLPDWRLAENDRPRVSLNADLPLPRESLKARDENAPLSLDLAINSLALDSLAPFLPQAARVPGVVDGGIKADGSLAALQLGGELTLAEPPAEDGGEAPAPSRVHFTMSGPVKQPNRWDVEMEALIGRLKLGGRRFEGISVALTTQEDAPGRPLLAHLRYTPRDAILDAEFRIDLSGADAIDKLGRAPIAGEASIEVTEIASVLADLAVPNLPLSGSLSASLGDLRLEEGSLKSGSFSMQAANWRIDDVPVEEVNAKGKVTAPDLLEADLVAALDAKNRLEAGGGFALKAKEYSGTATLRLDPDGGEGRLRSLLDRTAAGALFPSILSLDWSGQGSLTDRKHEGKLSLDARGLSLASGSDPLSVKISGRYEGPSAEFPQISIAGETLALDGSLRWHRKRLDMAMKGTSGGREAIDLHISAPADPEKLSADLWFGQDDPLSAAIQIDALSIRELSRWFQADPKLLGSMSLDFNLSGTPASPALEAKAALDDLSVPREGAAMPAGTLEGSLRSTDGTLAITGLYQHPDVKPLDIKATLPFHPGAWARRERKLVDEAIAASAKMERSSLGFLRGQVPGIETIEGEIALDAEVGGTIAAPQVKGSGLLTMSSLRFENRLAPSLQDIALEANFADNAVRIDRLSALVAGGTLEGEGGVRFQPGGEPQVDFSLNGSEVLVFRNTDVNVRTDLDVRLSGPFSKVAVTGGVGLTGSRFFKNFDLLPVGMPTKKTVSVLPTVERAPRGGGPAYSDLDVGVKQEPFSNWPLDLRIYTKDPFLIRSNLVESAIEADLRIGGTLGTPNPVGHVAISEGDMELPFSTVNVETGRIVFDQATGFNGAIEFKARGKADRYRISIYVYDRIFSPQYVLTSIPPLPSEDIMTLLVTGTTRSELMEGDVGSLAAGKAAGLLLKNLRKKSNTVDGERTLLDELEERTELELGRVNQETGEQTFGGRIRLWKQLFFVGDVDAESDYRALLKYVFRLE